MIDPHSRPGRLLWRIDALWYRAVFRRPIQLLNWICGSRSWQRPFEIAGAAGTAVAYLTRWLEPDRGAVEQVLMIIWAICTPLAMAYVALVREGVQHDLDRPSDVAPIGLNTLVFYRTMCATVLLLAGMTHPLTWTVSQRIECLANALALLSWYAVATEPPSTSLRRWLEARLPARALTPNPAGA